MVRCEHRALGQGQGSVIVDSRARACRLRSVVAGLRHDLDDASDQSVDVVVSVGRHHRQAQPRSPCRYRRRPNGGHIDAALEQQLLDRGIYVAAIRPPTVPAGTSRLRLSVMATHTDEDIDRLVAGVSEVIQETGAVPAEDARARP